MQHFLDCSPAHFLDRSPVHCVDCPPARKSLAALESHRHFLPGTLPWLWGIVCLCGHVFVCWSGKRERKGKREEGGSKGGKGIKQEGGRQHHILNSFTS